MDIEELKNKLGDEFEQFMALRQKCEVWTRVWGTTVLFRTITQASRANSLNASSSLSMPARCLGC